MLGDRELVLSVLCNFEIFLMQLSYQIVRNYQDFGALRAFLHSEY